MCETPANTAPRSWSLLGFLKSALRKIVDPIGPIGSIVSPSVVYKERLGFGVSASHAQRIQLETNAQVERALAPVRFVAEHEATPPKDRVRQVSAFVNEVWEPVYQKSASTDLNEIFAASQTRVGWRVRQEVRSAWCDCTKAVFEREADGEFVHRSCGRARKHLTAPEFAEVLQSAQIQATDEAYYTYAETIPGNDPVVMPDGNYLRGTPTFDADGRMTHDGIIRGGTQIKGRKHYRQVTKNVAHWDQGFLEKRAAGLAEESSRPVRNVKRALDAVAGESLPLWRPTGLNFRRDRRSAV